MVISKVIHFWKAYDIRNLKNNVYICTDARKAAISDFQNGRHKIWFCQISRPFIDIKSSFKILFLMYLDPRNLPKMKVSVG